MPGSYTEDALRDETTLTTLAGDDLAVNATGDRIRVGNATITIPDLVAKNGVIQGIDRVLFPNGANETPDLS